MFLLHSNFKNSHIDTSFFVFNFGGHILYLLVYVDDLIITRNNATIMNQFVHLLVNWFSLKDLGLLFYFLGVEIIPNEHGFFCFLNVAIC